MRGVQDKMSTGESSEESQTDVVLGDCIPPPPEHRTPIVRREDLPGPPDDDQPVKVKDKNVATRPITHGRRGWRAPTVG